jgi:hypothetical protein
MSPNAGGALLEQATAASVASRPATLAFDRTWFK